VGAAVTAPATAPVSFDSSGFTAKAAPKASPSARAGGAASRSGARTAVAGSARGSTIIAIAARYVGTPYRYGGTTPAGFDCSGFVRYVFAQVGVSLPRTANEQMNASRRISRSEARPGDLVFFVSGGRAYHNGIYAGGTMMYDSPRSGKSLQKREIWSSSVVFARVG
jgi:cell wall-associated NlpC family hydrolase